MIEAWRRDPYEAMTYEEIMQFGYPDHRTDELIALDRAKRDAEFMRNGGLYDDYDS